MTGQGKAIGIGLGPGNKTIATTLLEWLAVRGRSATRDRAARVLGEFEADLAAAPAWLGEDAVASMFSAGKVDASLARAIGHRLVSPDATGLRLYGLGLATPEKAYRRVQSLLPRESARAQWSVDEIQGRSARLRFDAAPSDDPTPAAPGRSEEALCALRTGMLEAIPGLFGLLPAEIHETNCRAEGSDACHYEVRWESAPRAGAITGLALGAVLAVGFVAALFLVGSLPPVGAREVAAVGVAALSLLVLGPAIGRVLDLQRQLEAVAGARRGHLALFDQVDDALAAKLDALARAEAKLEGEAPTNPVRRSSGDHDEADAGVSPESQRGILNAAQQIHAAAGDLECWFEAEVEGDIPETQISDERGLVREIREWAARIGELGATEGEATYVQIGLTALVGRAIATARPSLPPTAVIKIETDRELTPIECEPVQIEHLVVQLIRNAVEASVELSDAPEVLVTLKNAARGVELAVEDRGVGIESTEIDEVFDPFFGERSVAEGFGLTVCLRIIERHGGELRFENEDRAGTRVSVWLPEFREEKRE